MIVGIDPGLSGAVAALRPGSSHMAASVFDAIDMPTVQDGPLRQINPDALYRWIGRLNPARVVVENVWPMPRDGVIQAFRFGRSVGAIHAVCDLLGLKPELVAPQVWQGYFNLTGGDKAQSLHLARGIFPTANYLLKRKKDHNRAEAMLIALWAARPPIGKDW